MQWSFLSLPRITTKRIILLMSIQCIAFLATAQSSYIGYHSSTYTGVYGILNNPADILNHRFRGDVNLVGVSAGVGNNIVTFKYRDRGDDKEGFSFPNPITKKGRANVNVDVFGPSVLIKLSDQNAIALTTRARVMGNIYGISTPLLNSWLQDPTPLFTNVFIGSTAANMHAWKEIALTYSRQIANTDVGVWKVGASLKYLSGVDAANFSTLNLSYTNDSMFNPMTGMNQHAILNLQGSAVLNYTKNADSLSENANDYVSFKNPGFGMDIGVSYEYREEMQVYGTEYSEKTANYIWKIGASITDIGAIRYNRNQVRSFVTKFTGNNYFVDQLDLPSDSTEPYQISNYYKNLFNARTEPTVVTMQLPTMLHLSYDRFFTPFFGVQAQVNVPILFTHIKDHIGTYNPVSVSVTPRAEIPLGGAYLPISYNSIAGLQVGAAVRIGPLVIGSGSLISTRYLSTRGADAYVILRVPIFGYRKYKDDDYKPENPKVTKKQRKALDCPRK